MLANGLPTKELLILGIGTTLGIVLQALVMVPSLVRSGFRFRWRWGWDPRLTEAGGLVGWAIVYVLLSQVGVVDHYAHRQRRTSRTAAVRPSSATRPCSSRCRTASWVWPY